MTQLDEYFLGKRKNFDLPLSLHGTTFQLAVWKQLETIPYGKTKTYKDIAIGVGNEKAVRAVGLTNGRNPIAIVVPCHRVIGSNGKMVGYASGVWRKEWLLAHERNNYHL
jgi:methylated-DNA-[protein]-cysteine S-methyltransferase